MNNVKVELHRTDTSEIQNFAVGCVVTTSVQGFLYHNARIIFPSFSSSFQDFLTHLVCNLLHEGNALFRDKEWEQAVREFSEGLNVSSYAAGEEIQIPKALLESLYVNRAAAYHSLVRYGLLCF